MFIFDTGRLDVVIPQWTLHWGIMISDDRVDDEKLKSKPAGLLLEHLSWRCECVAKENKTAIRVCYLQLSKGWHVLQISPPINPILHGGFAFENIEKVLQTNTVLAAGRSVDSRSGWDKSNENMAKEESPRLISNSMYTCTQEARKVNADTDQGLQEESPIVCIKPRSALVLCTQGDDSLEILKCFGVNGHFCQIIHRTVPLCWEWWRTFSAISHKRDWIVGFTMELTK